MPQPTESEPLDFLLAHVCRLHYARAHALLEAIGLYRGQPPLLRALWGREGLTHTELAGQLNVTPATITKMLMRMERAGFLVRRPDARDQRVSRVYLTDTGRTIQRQVQAVWQIMEAETFTGFTPDECAMLRRFLVHIRENLAHVTCDPTRRLHLDESTSDPVPEPGE